MQTQRTVRAKTERFSRSECVQRERMKWFGSMKRLKTEEVARAGQREPCVQILLSTGCPAEC